MQINRLFQIIYILLEKKCVTATELSKKFEVSQRTIYRDIEILSQSGIPIYMSRGKGGGISFLPNYTFDKAVLTDREKQEVITALKAVRSVSIGNDDTVLDKLSNMLGEKNTNWIEIDFSSWGNVKQESENFERLKNAVIDKLEVNFTYASSNLEKTKRNVKPLKLVFKSASWYLYGYCTLRNDYRFFKLKRIEKLKVSDKKFILECPQKIIDDEFSYNKGKSIKAKIFVSSKCAFRVYDEFDDYVKDENGDFICKAEFPDMDILSRYVATYGEYCKLLEPQTAVEELKKRLARLTKMYNEK